MTKSKIMKFQLITRDVKFMETMNKLNETEWLGKEPGSCKLMDFKQKEPVPMGGTFEFEVYVEYKPQGCITINRGGFWYDGWKLRHIDVKRDGTLLDGKGQPLPSGADPVFLSWNVYKTTDFNKYDFGKFLGEEECDEIEVQ